jgi:hypothetical protein
VKVLHAYPDFMEKGFNALNLEYFEYRFFSQNNEDGLIEELLYHTGTHSKYYVEFGAGDGFIDSNTRRLREEFGWSGLLLDMCYINQHINLRKEYITAENINSLFSKYNVPCDLDLLSIDVDYNDFYIWNALDESYRPRVVVIEYNAAHLPQEDKVVQYHPDYTWDHTNYYGASLLSMFNLGRKKRYSLVYAEKSGANAFFIRDDLLPTNCLFKDINEVSKIYKYARYGKGPNGGHKKDPFCRQFLSSVDILGKKYY